MNLSLGITGGALDSALRTTVNSPAPHSRSIAGGGARPDRQPDRGRRRF